MDLKGCSKLYYQIKIANQVMVSRFEKKVGFSLTRYELMAFLKETGKCSQKKIQSELCIDSAAVTRHLKILEEKGYVIRERNKDNNREVFVEITEKAKKELMNCEKQFDASQNASCHSLTPEEEEQLATLLQKIIKQEED
ncbi:MarR family winged helix-turn-helix transcriptional regulator [Marinilactibacillus sp. Marseille-P9653]|uniref:MarR family winged helix-turn-helix transcriptional regulator n=1 Tax=Marinilactibacillus sp. Marseille-P9653 TaxID=2866583 RepID=UPI001CE3C6FF|nr:MarR family winged helix-turn-helix transcriptional regulator [Marinilactibacillus sp. Marseille-P9653]